MDAANEDHEVRVVHVCEDDQEAEIIIEFLHANGIEAMLDSNLPHSVLPVAEDVRIIVNHSDAEEAVRLLESREGVEES